MKIFCYFDFCPGLSIEDETRLIVLWREAWEKNVFEPVVLNEFTAARHPLFKQLDFTVSRLPSVNPPLYDRSCFLRYLAMAEVGGGLMADYDVFPYGWRCPLKAMPANLLGFQRHVPSLVAGTRQAYLKIVKAFMEYQLSPRDFEGGKPHVSDMLILLNSGVERTERHDVRNFGETGWEESKLVHYSTSTMTPKYLPRYKHIPLLRNPIV